MRAKSGKARKLATIKEKDLVLVLGTEGHIWDVPPPADPDGPTGDS